ncbi:hypothetical protein FACS1894211_16450 [Clostridia bacterium]|nr:hypothetical protein FACS1894211_16450 [Clostridia bacterium]
MRKKIFGLKFLAVICAFLLLPCLTACTSPGGTGGPTDSLPSLPSPVRPNPNPTPDPDPDAGGSGGGPEQPPDKGGGTETDPYRIRTEADLYDMYEYESASGETHKYYSLENDIELGDPPENAICNFIPVKSFHGTFLGNNHFIKNLYIDMSAPIAGLTDDRRAALFLVVERGAEISGLRLENVSVSGSEAAAFACENYGNITDCSADGEILGGNQCGGIAASNFGRIIRCVNAATVTGTAGYCGGIVGLAGPGASVSRCANLGAVRDGGNVSFMGGVAGYDVTGKNAQSGAEFGITDCVSLGPIETEACPRAGVVTGGTEPFILSSPSHTEDCYYLRSLETAIVRNAVGVWKNGGISVYPFEETDLEDILASLNLLFVVDR